MYLQWSILFIWQILFIGKIDSVPLQEEWQFFDRQPYVASIQHNNEHKCSGTVIAKNWVLTSGSCLDVPQDMCSPNVQENFKVVVVPDQTNISNILELKINYFVIHPDYWKNREHIALIKVSEDLSKYIIKSLTDHLEYYKLISGWKCTTKDCGPSFSVQTVLETERCSHDATCFKQMEKSTVALPQECSSFIGGPIFHTEPKGCIVHLGTVVYLEPDCQGSGRAIVANSSNEWIMDVMEKGKADEDVEARMPARPEMVSIQYDGKHICSGALIKPQWVLTSKFCLIIATGGKVLQPESLTVFYGNNDLIFAQEVNVEQIKLQEKPTECLKRCNYEKDDLALLKLTKDVTTPIFKLPVKPVHTKNCIAYTFKVNTIPTKTRKRFISTGKSCLSRSKNVTLTSMDECLKLSINPKLEVRRGHNSFFHEDKNVLKLKTIHIDNINDEFDIVDNFYCAAPEDYSICLSDFGAVLVCGDVLTGLSNWGMGCVKSNSPELWLRVDRYLTWIAEQVGKTEIPKLFGSVSKENKNIPLVLIEKNGGTMKQICTGIIYNETTIQDQDKIQVLTSASCVRRNIGDCNNAMVTIMSNPEKMHNVSSYIYSSHKFKFNHDNHFFKDLISLVIKPIENIEDINVVSLAKTKPLMGTLCTAYSFAMNDDTVHIQQREATVRLVETKICQDFYGEIDLQNEQSFPNYENVLCTVNEFDSSDVCMIEKGTPLLCNNELNGFGMLKYGCRENIKSAPTVWSRVDQDILDIYIDIFKDVQIVGSSRRKRQDNVNEPDSRSSLGEQNMDDDDKPDIPVPGVNPKLDELSFSGGSGDVESGEEKSKARVRPTGPETTTLKDLPTDDMGYEEYEEETAQPVPEQEIPWPSFDKRSQFLEPSGNMSLGNFPPQHYPSITAKTVQKVKVTSTTVKKLPFPSLNNPRAEQDEHDHEEPEGKMREAKDGASSHKVIFTFFTVVFYFVFYFCLFIFGIFG